MSYLVLALLLGCADSIHYTLGSGVVYHTRCAARMAVEGDTYRALCTPPPCAEGFDSAGVSHVVAALDPGNKVLGNAERACVRDMADIVQTQRLFMDGEEQPVGPGR